jgi:putative ABC transport system substrate-binding protein
VTCAPRRSRRRLCAALLAAGLPGWAARAQSRKARIAFLGGGVGPPDPGTLRYQTDPLRQGLRELGYVEGQNLQIEWRFAEGRFDRLPALLAELIAWGPDVLVTSAPRPALLAKEATQTIPIVAVAVDDPVQMGLAQSYARPGGNITGLSGAYHGLVSRRMQLLKDFVPTVRRIGVVMNPDSVPRQALERDLAEPARALGVELLAFEVRGLEDIDAAFAAMQRERIDGVLVLADAVFYKHRMRIGELCTKQRLPSVWGAGGYLDAGGLASFQGDFGAMFRRSAGFVDKILKGAKPGDIPFEQSTKFELVLNLKAARALGLKVPQSVLVSADEVIE